jgi:hypothetical protein
MKGKQKNLTRQFIILYSTAEIVSVIKSRRMSWDGYVGQFGKNEYEMFDAKILGNRP